ncbi:cyclic AMP-responsive element-binding protein 3-like protein 2 isoform X2 [Acropora palmata]|uniref:cyclic AMP-responsive element-binding protein 3-like protein 2 isoform X2 n=1 Tax=Acropora palmata TaxID=6131 RepID=UPI003DA1260D
MKICLTTMRQQTPAILKSAESKVFCMRVAVKRRWMIWWVVHTNGKIRVWLKITAFHRPEWDANILIFNADTEGRVKLTDEEKETFVSEGLPIPNRIPLTKAEERALKRIRRKIKNKLSAQESRRKKKEYVEGLEKRVEACNSENSILQQKVDSLETTVRALLTELNRLRKVALEKESRKRTLKAKSIGTQTGTCLKCHLKKEALDREKNFTAERQKAFRDNAKPYMERFNGLRIKSRD